MSRIVKDQLREFYERRHPEFHSSVGHWAFLRATYDGGRDWFNQHVFKFHKEGDEEFRDRVSRAYRFNHTREVVDLVVKYLFKGKIARNDAAASQVVKDFWQSSTLEGLSIDQIMRLISTNDSIYGRIAIVVDNNLPADAITIAEARVQGAKIYCYMVTADDVLDYAYDEDGNGDLLWIKLRERVRDDTDPIFSSGEITERVRLWTRDAWYLFQEQEQGSGRNKTKRIVLIDQQDHDLGEVPVILKDHTIGANPYKAPGLIDDIAYLDRAVANYLSNLDAIIQDQTFSQLAMPAQGVLPGEDTYNKVLELGTKRVFIYDGGSGSTAKPEYLSPDPKQAGVILTVINKIINEIYHTVGLAGERTKEDNAVGIDNSSGVAKAYDFERVNSLLLTKAQSCENAENKLVRLVCLWAGEEAPAEKLVSYPETFDVMRLADELVVAEALRKINAPIEVSREHMRIVVDKLFPKLSADIKAKIKKDIDGWMEGVDIASILNPPTKFGDKPTTAPSRQGSVTKDTAK